MYAVRHSCGVQHPAAFQNRVWYSQGVSLCWDAALPLLLLLLLVLLLQRQRRRLMGYVACSVSVCTAL
jgi:hypothetical protein